uniref:Uncharacterized protein n=1 Tax=Anguilla anguilla TaxID=7936 RepID=A0A0E9T6L6_ANGAN
MPLENQQGVGFFSLGSLALYSPSPSASVILYLCDGHTMHSL